MLQWQKMESPKAPLDTKANPQGLGLPNAADEAELLSSERKATATEVKDALAEHSKNKPAEVEPEGTRTQPKAMHNAAQHRACRLPDQQMERGAHSDKNDDRNILLGHGYRSATEEVDKPANLAAMSALPLNSLKDQETESPKLPAVLTSPSRKKHKPATPKAALEEAPVWITSEGVLEARRAGKESGNHDDSQLHAQDPSQQSKAYKSKVAESYDARGQQFTADIFSARLNDLVQDGGDDGRGNGGRVILLEGRTDSFGDSSVKETCLIACDTFKVPTQKHACDKKQCSILQR